MTRTVLSHYVRWPAAWLAALLLLAAPLPAVAQSVELLQDHAGVLALPQRQHIESVQANLLQRWQTPLALVTLQQMGSAQANSRLSQLNNQLYQHPDVGSAVVLVWDAQHNDILMSFGPDWADAEMSQALLAALSPIRAKRKVSKRWLRWYSALPRMPERASLIGSVSFCCRAMRCKALPAR